MLARVFNKSKNFVFIAYGLETSPKLLEATNLADF